jgi:hypothetical protein
LPSSINHILISYIAISSAAGRLARHLFVFITMVLRKDQLEVALKDEHQLIQSGVIRDDSPLDLTPEFQKLCDACRVGDTNGCHEAITTGVNINARDPFDYTPLILVSALYLLFQRNTALTRTRRASADTMRSFSFSLKLGPYVNEIPSRGNDVYTML